MKAGILSSIDICEAREALARCEEAKSHDMVYMTKGEFRHLFKAFQAMEKQIRELIDGVGDSCLRRNDGIKHRGDEE